MEVKHIKNLVVTVPKEQHVKKENNRLPDEDSDITHLYSKVR